MHEVVPLSLYRCAKRETRADNITVPSMFTLLMAQAKQRAQSSIRAFACLNSDAVLLDAELHVFFDTPATAVGPFAWRPWACAYGSTGAALAVTTLILPISKPPRVKHKIRLF